MWHQLDYFKRHYQTVIRHLTPKKIANILFNTYEMEKKKVILKSRPPFLKVEPTALCQLHCPGCPWHQEASPREFSTSGNLSYDKFVKLIDPIRDTTVEISFSLRGDAFMNRDIFDMISYCRKYNIGSEIPTNFSYKFNDETLERIIDCGLDHIIIAVDGTTQEVYEQYRKGGHLDWVLDNARRLIELKRKKHSKTPLVECKFISFVHNEHQFEEAKKLSESMGFDRFSTVLDHFHPKRKAEFENTIRKSDKKKKSCYWVYRTSVICWDGQVCPCCNDRFNLGNAVEDGFLNVWNNEHYRAMRTMFITGEPVEEQGKVCIGCRTFWATFTHESEKEPVATA